MSSEAMTPNAALNVLLSGHGAICEAGMAPCRRCDKEHEATEVLRALITSAAVEQACAVPAPSATPSKSEGEWVAPGEPRRPECADPNCGLSTDTAEAFRVIRDCEQYDYCHVECAMSHERDLGRQDGIAESEGEWAVECLDAWTARSEARYYEVDKMGFDAAALGVGRQWRCNCFEVQNSPGREPRKVHIANGLSYESANDVRLAAARALYAADNSLPPPPKAPDAT